MKPRFSQRIHILIWAALLFTQTGWSQFENTIGNLAGSDETTDIKPLPNGHTIVLANTTSYGADKILLLELDPGGHALLYTTIYDLANPNVPYSGNSLDLDLDAAGNPNGYFITGCKGVYPTQMILIRTDLNGIPTWAEQMDNTDDPHSPISECGISLERQTNRDIIVVGQSDQAGDLRFTASRFSAAGLLNWSNRYGSTTGLQFIPNESYNGKRNHEDVVAVVGHIHDTGGIGHTFLSCIRADNGLEFWRSQYNSDHYHDDGTDVVQHPVNQRFFIEGHAEELLGSTRLWTVVVNPNNGNLTSGATYSLLPPFHGFFGRDICLNPLNNTVAITGFCDVEPASGAAEIRTFILNMPFFAGAAPNFCHFFTHSEPQLFLLADDAIEFVNGPNPGYVLGTQAKLPGAAVFDYDVHALRLNLLGVHPFSDCPVVAFTPEINSEGEAFNLKKNKTASTWTTLLPAATNQEYIEDPCGGSAPPPQLNIPESLSRSVTSTQLFPNPAAVGQELNIMLDIEESSDIVIELFDMTGRLQQRWNQWHDEGDNQIRLDLPLTLSEKIYLVKLSFSNGQCKIFRLMIE